MTSSDDYAFEQYLKRMVMDGHPRDWVRRNAPGLRQRFDRGELALPPPSAPPEPVRDRYEEL